MKKIKMQETVLRQHRGYKGCIRWVKLIINGHIYKIEKRRPFGWESYDITENEYNWIDNPKKAAKMWDFVHYHGTACWFGGELEHPMTKVKYQGEDALAERPAA